MDLRDKIIFGPILSRRFGKSLGIDLSPSSKQCNFDCLYCELEGKRALEAMQEVLEVEHITEALFSRMSADIDVITITANGEPTLYPHLLELITRLKTLLPPKIQTLILSNGSRFHLPAVQEALKLFDIVKFSFDAGVRRDFLKVDRPHQSLNLDQIKAGILDFSARYKGQLVAEVLFVKDANDNPANLQSLAEFFKQVSHLHRIDLSTIDRPPAYDQSPITHEKLESIAAFLRAQLQVPIHIPERKPEALKLQSLSEGGLLDLIKRRPLEVSEAQKMFDPPTLQALKNLEKTKQIHLKLMGNLFFYTAKR